MTGTGKRKGDAAEREAAALLGTLMEQRGIRRLLGAGRADDIGDIGGVPGWAIQVAWWPHDTLRAIRDKPVDAAAQARNSDTYGAAMIRLVGGTYRIVMTPEEFVRAIADLRQNPGPTLLAPPKIAPPGIPILTAGGRRGRALG